MEKAKLISILDKLKKVISEIEKSDNIKIDIGTISHTQSSFTTSLKGLDLSKLDDIDKSNLSMSKVLGFTQNIVGFEFKSGKDNDCFKVTEFKMRNRIYPIIAKKMSNGKAYKFSSKYVLDRIGGTKQVNRIANLDSLLK